MISIYTDGGSRGNPGKAACSFVAVKSGEIIYEESHFLGKKTNNEAEYNAIIYSITWAIKNKINDFEIISDSELVIRQINGEYKIKKEHLAELNGKITKMIKENSLKVKFSNLRREDQFISRADLLVNKKLDEN